MILIWWAFLFQVEAAPEREQARIKEPTLESSPVSLQVLFSYKSVSLDECDLEQGDFVTVSNITLIH
jgi:hypothetical protein